MKQKFSTIQQFPIGKDTVHLLENCHYNDPKEYKTKKQKKQNKNTVKLSKMIDRTCIKKTRQTSQYVNYIFIFIFEKNYQNFHHF